MSCFGNSKNLQFGKFQKLVITKIKKNKKLETPKNLRFGKLFQKLSDYEISKISNSWNFKNFQFVKFQKISI